jgi:hypothetical protein
LVLCCVRGLQTNTHAACPMHDSDPTHLVSDGSHQCQLIPRAAGPLALFLLGGRGQGVTAGRGCGRDLGCPGLVGLQPHELACRGWCRGKGSGRRTGRVGFCTSEMRDQLTTLWLSAHSCDRHTWTGRGRRARIPPPGRLVLSQWSAAAQHRLNGRTLQVCRPHGPHRPPPEAPTRPTCFDEFFYGVPKPVAVQLGPGQHEPVKHARHVAAKTFVEPQEVCALLC